MSISAQEKSDVIQQYRIHQKDTGSPEVQIALLTEKIHYLTEHFTPYPGVLVRLSSISRKELRKILSDAWQQAMENQSSAPKPRGKASAPARKARR